MTWSWDFKMLLWISHASSCSMLAHHTGLLVFNDDTVRSTSKAKGAVVYLISNSRLSETCFNLLKKWNIKTKNSKKRWKYTNLCQWRSPFIPVLRERLWKTPPQGGDRIHTSTHECLLFFFHNLVFLCCTLMYFGIGWKWFVVTWDKSLF